jgi:hypothetical protein
MLPKSDAILAGWYSLHVVVTLFFLFAGSTSVVQIVASILSLIVVLALTNTAGRWADATSLIYSALLTIVGVATFGVGLWSITTPAGVIPTYVVFGLILTAVSGRTVLVFRQKLSISSQPALRKIHS